MLLVIRIFLPLIIVAAAFWFARDLYLSRPEPRNFDVPPQVTAVNATRLKPESFQIYLDTQGTVRPRTTSNLLPEVSGRIVSISANFREGGFFEEGETLLTVDRLNYETALVSAESNAAQAEVTLREEEVRSQQARDNWQRLGKRGTPSEMVLRKPQLAEAKARLAAAKADIRKAERDLERTQIRAPFAGRILSQNVDVGQVVSPSTVLGQAFATDIMEVRLPLTNRQLGFVSLPEIGTDAGVRQDGPTVEIISRLGRAQSNWEGRIVRVDSAIDERSRQLFVVAEIDDPYQRNSKPGAVATERKGAPLKIGMFVDAKVAGRRLDQVFVLPRSAVRVGGEVILIDSENRIRRQTVTPVWSGKDSVVVEPGPDSGLKSGDILCLTPLAYPANGARVLPTIDGVAPIIANPEFGPGSGGAKGGGKGGKGKGKGKSGKAKPEDREETSEASPKKTEQKSAL